MNLIIFTRHYSYAKVSYSIFNKEVPQVTKADEKTINYCIDELLKNPANSSHKLAVDTCISENL